MRFQDVTRNRSSKTRFVISTPEEITPDWMTTALHRCGVAKHTRVEAVEVILRKELPISTVCRLGVSYTDAADESCPRSLFLKLPRVLNKDPKASDADDRAEVEFYTVVAPRVGCPPLVPCYDAAYSDTTGRSHILLDDLTGTHSQPQQEHAPSEEMSRLAVEALAKAHAAWWNRAFSDSGFGTSNSVRDNTTSSRSSDSRVPPIPGQRREFDLRKFVEDLNTSVEQFLAIADLTPRQEKEYRRMLDAADVIWGRMTRPSHLTVTHGDTHWWNLLYPKDPRTHSVHIIDWHLWHIDLGARDLAFLLALGGFAEPRPSLEEELLRVYHSALGVSDYSCEMLIQDYRWSSIRNLNIPVIYWSQGKHESTWRTALRRAFEAYERLDCGSLT